MLTAPFMTATTTTTRVERVYVSAIGMREPVLNSLRLQPLSSELFVLI